MMRQTTELRANSMAKQSMDMILKNMTSSFIAQLSQNEEQLTENTLILILESLGQRKKSFADVFCRKVYDIKPRVKSKGHRQDEIET